MDIGTKIRELRKKKGITQEALASALSVTPQAVSKWESSLSYPDITLIPTIAAYFGVSLDTLFDFDIKEIKDNIEKILNDAWDYLFDDTTHYIEIIQTALKEYPENEALLSALLDAYEYDLRTRNNTGHLDEMIELSQKLITESTDLERICSVKEIQAAAYLAKGSYTEAKTVIESLPVHVTLRDDVMSFRLSGRDKLNGAVLSRCSHLQSLYEACMNEGDAWFKMDSATKFRDYTPDDFIPNALHAYRQGLTVLETFLIPNTTGQRRYLWDGMQTFHYSFRQRIAACMKRMGQFEECSAEIEEAYRIISTSWDDFEEKRDYYMEPFNKYLTEYGLEEFTKQ